MVHSADEQEADEPEADELRAHELLVREAEARYGNLAPLVSSSSDSPHFGSESQGAALLRACARVFLHVCMLPFCVLVYVHRPPTTTTTHSLGTAEQGAGATASAAWRRQEAATARTVRGLATVLPSLLLHSCLHSCHTMCSSRVCPMFLPRPSYMLALTISLTERESARKREIREQTHTYTYTHT